MNASQTEESLAKKYRQPKGVEQFGIEAVSDELRTVRWWDTFLIVLNFVVNPGTIVISGSLIAAGMSFSEAILTGFLSIVIGFSVYLVAATVGVDYGIPGLVSMRGIFGIRGSWIASGLRAVSSVYWFAFQTIAGSIGLAAVLQAMLGRPVSLAVISIVFALFQVAVATVGYNSLRILSRYTFVFKIVASIVLVVVLMNYPQASFHPSAVFSFGSTEGWKWGLIALWSTGMAAAWFSNFTDAADFCRYSKTRVDMWIGTFMAAVVGQIICSFVGGYAVAAVMGKTDNAFDVIVQSANGAMWLLILIFLYIVMDNWTINVQNLYTGGLAISNVFVSLGRFWGTLIVSVFGVGLSLLPQLVNGYIGYMSILGDLFAPMGAVFVAHYLFFSRGKLDLPALYERTKQYWYWGGYNWVALVWMVLGFFINRSIPQSWVNILCTTVIVGTLYGLSVVIIRKKSSILRNATSASSSVPAGADHSSQVHVT